MVPLMCGAHEGMVCVTVFYTSFGLTEVESVVFCACRLSARHADDARKFSFMM